MIYISKLDLLTEMQEGSDKNKKTFNQLTDYEQIKSDYEQIGYDVFFDAEHLVSNLAGKVTVFMGQTGAGKTTLLNKLHQKCNWQREKLQKNWDVGVIRHVMLNFLNWLVA